MYKAGRIPTFQSFQPIAKVLYLASFLNSSYGFTERDTHAEAGEEWGNILTSVDATYMNA